MGHVLLDQVIYTDYGQFDLVWSDGAGFDGNWSRFFDGQLNGWVGAADPGGVYVNLARPFGGSRVRIVRHDAEPPPAAPRFEDVVEVSVTVPAGAQVQWTSWAGEAGGPVALAPGEYRLRVGAHGRDADDDDEFQDAIVDDYLLEFWAAGPRPDEVIRAESQNGQYWHREVGGRRTCRHRRLPAG